MADTVETVEELQPAAQPQTAGDDHQDKPCECEKRAECARRKATIIFAVSVIAYLLIIVVCIKLLLKK